MAILQIIDDNDIKNIEIKNRDEIIQNQQCQIKYLREDNYRERKLRCQIEEKLNATSQMLAASAAIAIVTATAFVFLLII